MGYLKQYEFLGAILATLIGAGIAYFVQTKTQEKTWKREYSVRIAEEVYGILYGKLKNIIFWLNKNEPTQLDFYDWRDIQNGHRYFMVGKELRTSIDTFYLKVEGYNTAIYTLKEQILPKIIDESGLAVFKSNIKEVVSSVKFKELGNTLEEDPNFINCLLSETYPINYILERNPEREFLSFRFHFGILPLQPRVRLEASEYEMQLFEKFWKLCLEKMSENETFKLYKSENKKLLK